MTHEQACEYFTTNILPMVQEMYEQDGDPDIPARSEEWNNWTDGLREDGEITTWQYENWDHPPCNY